jgi:hypothetical protein
MAKVAREMVEKAGIDVDHLVDLLVKNAAAELTTFYYYTILRFNLIGLDGEGIKEIAENGPHRGPQPLRGAGTADLRTGGQPPCKHGRLP